MAFLTRYIDDDSRPTVGSALRDVLVRAVLPAIALWLVIVGIGKLIEGPLGGLQGESSINRSLQAGRTATWDAVTMVWSHIGNTEIVIGVCVVMVGLIWWLTKQWWVAVIPAIAIAIQATVFVVATAVTGRDRPEVEHLDPAPPTSSYPSGHVGASTALYLTLAAMCQRIPNQGAPLRAHRDLSGDPAARGVRAALPRHAPPQRRPRRVPQRDRLRRSWPGTTCVARPERAAQTRAYFVRAKR